MSYRRQLKIHLRIKIFINFLRKEPRNADKLATLSLKIRGRCHR